MKTKKVKKIIRRGIPKKKRKAAHIHRRKKTETTRFIYVLCIKFHVENKELDEFTKNCTFCVCLLVGTEKLFVLC